MASLAFTNYVNTKLNRDYDPSTVDDLLNKKTGPCASEVQLIKMFWDELPDHGRVYYARVSAKEQPLTKKRSAYVVFTNACRLTGLNANKSVDRAWRDLPEYGRLDYSGV